MNPQAMFDLTGRVGMVSGAAQGLGREMACAWAGAGADLLLVDRNFDGAEQTASEIRQLGRRAIAHQADVSKPEEIVDVFTRLDDELGHIDMLANVAGDGILAPPETITIEQVQAVFANLVLGRFCCCQEAGRRMLRAGRGSIINIGSIASLTALGRGHIAYSMAMGAVAQMTRELSTEWSSGGVRVNAILPAQVANPSLELRMTADPNLRGMFLRGIAAGRLGRPSDIAGLAVFLASDAASWITGALIPMDGGNLALNGGGTVRRPQPA